MRQIFSWKRVASGITFKRFFKKFTQSLNHSVFIELKSWFFEQLQLDNYTLNVDSNVIFVMESRREASEDTIPPNGGVIAIIPCLLL
ncbi:MAG: hypothetical protein H7320_01155 [Ferruginibacter sp.]|nr:hypothetical protein [Ferruginibacter sp.]